MPSKARRTLRLTIFALAALLSSGASLADEKAAKPATPPTRDELVAAARKVMTSQTYCALITHDASGRPSVRTMNPFPPEDDLTVWFATNDRSRKVAEMRANPRVTLYYADHANASGYVSLSGRAVLVDDEAEILKRKRAYWDTSFPGLKNLVLVKVVPEKLDVLNYEGKIVVDPVTWRTPSIDVGPVTATP
ncbi:MAG: pyridoxamine 5'-phosphate oxidase family protein [Thermoanaerobaculia bacterium]